MSFSLVAFHARGAPRIHRWSPIYAELTLLSEALAMLVPPDYSPPSPRRPAAPRSCSSIDKDCTTLIPFRAV